MSAYDVFITYTKASGKGNKKRQEVIECMDMMEATTTRLDRQDDPDVENIVIRPAERNDFPFDDPELFMD